MNSVEENTGHRKEQMAISDLIPPFREFVILDITVISRTTKPPLVFKQTSVLHRLSPSIGCALRKVPTSDSIWGNRTPKDICVCSIDDVVP